MFYNISKLLQIYFASFEYVHGTCHIIDPTYILYDALTLHCTHPDICTRHGGNLAEGWDLATTLEGLISTHILLFFLNCLFQKLVLNKNVQFQHSCNWNYLVWFWLFNVITVRQLYYRMLYFTILYYMMKVKGL